MVLKSKLNQVYLRPQRTNDKGTKVQTTQNVLKSPQVSVQTIYSYVDYSL